MVMDKELRAYTLPPLLSTNVSLVYNGTCVASPLRKFVVDWSLQCTTANYYEPTLPKCMLFDVYKKVAEIQSVKEASTPLKTVFIAPWEQDKCCYHQHNEAVPKCTSDC
jgi:hypothetical protein